MQASMAFLNGAGSQRHGRRAKNAQALELLNTLLTAAGSDKAAGDSHQDHGAPTLDRGKSQDEHKAELEKEEPTFTEPDGFKNQPDDPTNPNEARERQRRKLTP